MRGLQQPPPMGGMRDFQQPSSGRFGQGQGPAQGPMGPMGGGGMRGLQQPPPMGGMRDFQQPSMGRFGQGQGPAQGPTGPMGSANPFRAVDLNEKNFNAASMADFRQPYGMNQGGPRQNIRPTTMGRSATGAMPGPSYAGGAAPGPSFTRPPMDEERGPMIDDERRNRSPGLQNNFYDKSQADFKRPYGTGNGATSPPATEVSSNAGSAGPVQIGEEAPMPGREEEYTAFKAQEAAAPPGPPFVPPPIDDTRRNKSPGIQNNFYDTDVADFKRPYGFGRGPAPPPPAAQPPPAASPEE
jgi:hypothetical protein